MVEHLLSMHKDLGLTPGIRKWERESKNKEIIGGVDQALGGVHRGGLAGAELPVDLQQGLFIALAGVLLQGGQDALVLAKELQNFRVAAGAQSPDETGDRELAVLVDADIEHVAQVGLILQPGAPAGDDGGRIGLVVRLVHLAGVGLQQKPPSPSNVVKTIFPFFTGKIRSI